MKQRKARGLVNVCIVLAVLFAGWLYGCSGWIPGKDAAKARGLREKITDQVPPGTSRADAEAFLKREGIDFHYYSRGDAIFSNFIEAAKRQTEDPPAKIPVEKIYGFTDSSLDTKYAAVPDHGERVFLQLFFDRNEKMLGYEWDAFAPGF